MIPSIALKYARALAELAAEGNQQDLVHRELVTVNELFQAHGKLIETLKNPSIPFSAKRGIVEQIAETVSLSPMVVNFTLVLLEKARIHQFDQMVGAYQVVLDERQGIVRGEVTSCQAISPAIQQRLEEVASSFTGRKVRLDYHTDESLIGGLRLQMGSTVLDGSIRTQLNEMRRRLTAEQ